MFISFNVNKAKMDWLSGRGRGDGHKDAGHPGVILHPEPDPLLGPAQVPAEVSKPEMLIPGRGVGQLVAVVHEDLLPSQDLPLGDQTHNVTKPIQSFYFRRYWKFCEYLIFFHLGCQMSSNLALGVKEWHALWASVAQYTWQHVSPHVSWLVSRAPQLSPPLTSKSTLSLEVGSFRNICDSTSTWQNQRDSC